MPPSPEDPLGVAFTRLAEDHPDRPAVTDDDATLTFAELEARANRWAGDLAERGVTPGSFVSIALPNGVEHYAVTLATWKLGAIPQPLSARLPAAEIAAVLAVVRPAALVGAEIPGWPGVPAGHAPTGAATPPPPAPAPPWWKAPTSGGSTGRPKVILAGQPGTYGAVTSRASAQRIEPDGVFLCTAPLHHNAPFLFSLIALLLGHHVVVMPRFDADRALDLAERHGVTWFYTVPTMLRRMLLTGRRPALPALETMFHVGAPCPPAVKREVIDWVGPDRVLEIYAGTEAQARTAITGREWLAHPGSVGRVVDGEMEIRDAEDRVCPPGVVGEVWMRPPPDVVTYRYVGAEARARAGGWESLGDMGWFDEDGYLHLADRAKDMIVVGGENVYPAEVEAALLEHPSVISAVVVPRPDDDLGSVPHALVQLAAPTTDEELAAHVDERLARYKRPRSYERRDEALRDDAGKVRRSIL